MKVKIIKTHALLTLLICIFVFTLSNCAKQTDQTNNEVSYTLLQCSAYYTMNSELSAKFSQVLNAQEYNDNAKELYNLSTLYLLTDGYSKYKIEDVNKKNFDHQYMVMKDAAGIDFNEMSMLRIKYDSICGDVLKNKQYYYKNLSKSLR